MQKVQNINNTGYLKKEKETGYVKWFDQTHGYGFIVNDDTKKEVFFHFSNTLDKVSTADQVRYNTIEGRKGLIAIDIERVKTK